MDFRLFFIFLIWLTLQQYQQCNHLKGTRTIGAHYHFEIQGKYNESNTIGSTAFSSSFLVNNSSEILVCFGESQNLPTDRIWKYSIAKNQWMFLNGRFEGQSSSLLSFFENTGEFKKNNKIGARRSTAGWSNLVNGDEIISFFGGYTRVSGSNSYRLVNELWKYHVKNNSYAVIRFNEMADENDTDQYYTTLESEKGVFHENNIPGGRENHEIVKLNEDGFTVFFNAKNKYPPSFYLIGGFIQTY